jgi:3-oxoacyl-[acyl-carrier protein] reductase
MFDLTGKTALVTGATGGIGAAIAKALHAQGAHVVLSGTRETVLQARAAELGARTSAVVANLSDPAAVDGLIEAAEAAAGAPIDILVANAGITKDGLLLRMKDDDWAEVIKINLESYFRLSRAACKGMMRRRNGRIIGITSIVGVMGNPGQANYAASKAGLVGLARSLAREFASRNITVNVVAPGPVATDMFAAVDDSMRDAITEAVPLGRMAEPDEIAAAISFLASDAAGYITGVVLPVDGGLGMGG